MARNGAVGVLLESDNGGSFIVGCVGDGRMWIRDGSGSRRDGVVDNDCGSVVGFAETVACSRRWRRWPQ